MEQEGIIEVNGMVSGDCELKVKKACYALPGVDKVRVELRSKLVTVRYEDSQVDEAKIKAAIAGQGFDVK